MDESDALVENLRGLRRVLIMAPVELWFVDDAQHSHEEDEDERRVWRYVVVHYEGLESHDKVREEREEVVRCDLATIN